MLRPTLLTSLALLGGCKTAAVHDDTPTTQRAAATAVAVEAGTTAAAAVVDAGAPIPTALFPVAEGACTMATAYAVGTTPVLVGGREAWTLTADGATPFFRQPGARVQRFRGTRPR